MNFVFQFIKNTKWHFEYTESDELDNGKLKRLRSVLSSLKSEKGKIDIAKLETVQVDVRKLIDVVKSDAIKKTEYDKLVKKVYAIELVNLLLKQIIMLRSKIIRIKYLVNPCTQSAILGF